MILSDTSIKNAIGNDIVITPYNEENLRQNSYVLRLDTELFMYNAVSLDIKKEPALISTPIPEEGYLLFPNTIYFTRTLEYTETHAHIPVIEELDTLECLGLFVKTGFGQVGFKGYWALQLSCLMPITIYPGMEICQIVYHEISAREKINPLEETPPHSSI